MVARPEPRVITVITRAIGTINNPRAILLTAGSWRQEIQPPPALRGPAGLQQCQPARVPGPSPTPLGWPRVGQEPGPHTGRQGSGPAMMELPSQARSLSCGTRAWRRGGGGHLGSTAAGPHSWEQINSESRGLGCPLAGSYQGKLARLVQWCLGFPARSPLPLCPGQGPQCGEGSQALLLAGALVTAPACQRASPHLRVPRPPVPGVPSALAWPGRAVEARLAPRL